MNLARRIAVLAALLLAAPTALAERDLAQVLGELTASLGINFVLEGPAILDRPVPDGVTTLAGLEQWLTSQGLAIKTLANGDRVIRAGAQGQLSLRALPVTATPLQPPSALAATASGTRLDADMLDALGARQLDQLFPRAANVFGSADEYYVRGVPSGGELNTLGNAAAQLGTAPLPNLVLGRLPLTTWDLHSAGFERGTRDGGASGPFSTYAGNIRLVPAPPVFERTHALRLAGDHRGGSQLGLMLNRPLIDEELALRVSVDDQRREGYLRDLQGRIFDDADSRTARLGLVWEPLRWPAARWAIDVHQIRGSSGPQRLIADRPGDRSGSSAPYCEQRLSAWIAAASASLETRSGHHWQLDAVATRGRSALDPTRPLSNTFDPPHRLIDRERSQLRSLQLQWQRQFEAWRLGAGLSAGHNRRTEILLRDQAEWRLDNALSRTSAVLELQWEATPAWSLELRLRRSRDRLFRDCQARATGEPAEDCFEAVGLLLTPADGAFAAFRDRYGQWSPEAVVGYSPQPGRHWFLRLQRGFNAGGAVSSARFSGQPFWIFYEPERARTAELGWQERADRWQTSLTAFYTSLRGQWTARQGGAFLQDVANDGYSLSYGLELEAGLALGARHSLDLSAGWLQTRYRQYTPFERDAMFESAAGNVFAGAPGYSGAVTWRARLSDSWRWSLAASYHGPVQANANNPQFAELPGRVLLDAQLAWQRGAVTLAARFDNLLDRDYQQTTPAVSRRTQRIDYLPGPPRTFGLSFELDF